MTKDWEKGDGGEERDREREREMGVKGQEGGVKAGLHMSHQRHWGGLTAMPRRMVPPMAIQISCKVGGKGAHTRERTARGTSEDTTNHNVQTITHTHTCNTRTVLNKTSKHPFMHTHAHTLTYCSNSKGDHHVQL